MNITELDQYNLADAVKFHNRLNPKIWDRDEKLLPEVREKLLEIAADFQEFLGVSDLEVEDITVSGSNAAYSYTPHSDIDLHLVVRQPQQDDEVYQELFNAKKYQYNDIHNIRIHGADVELYVQPADEPPVSLGEYSIKNDEWLQVPKRKRARIDQTVVRHKYEDLKARIENAVKDDDSERIQALATKIKEMRRAGLDAHGEFGPENLAYKMLRKQGYIQKLYDAIAAAKDRELSLKELAKPKQRVRYGFGEGHQGQSYSSEDGVAASTCMYLNEEDTESTLMNFIEFVAQELGIKNMPKIHLHDDPEWGIREQSFGKYIPETHDLHVNLANRHIMDIMRTTAHELCHCKQHEIEPLDNDPTAGDTGSDMENEAHAVAGIIMRNWADKHPELFAEKPISEASGYIPTKAQAQDPRFKMALTVDVHPGQTGKEANKMSLKTDKQGKPALLMKTANLLESQIAAEFEEFTEGKSYGYNSTPLSQVPGEREDELGNQEATGPEFPPQMPAGTTKIDVSDLTDWYRVGMDISDLDDADPKDYNQGPPQTVIVFPSDEAEQGYLKQFKRLGLKTHDMDPDVEGGEDLTGKHLHKELAEAFELLEEEFLSEVKMTSKNLAKLAKDIPGVKVGLEFEMIVPNASVEEEDMEPDYDEDQRVRDIDDAVNFFDDGDYNDRSSLRRLREQMESDFFDWQIGQMDEAWHNNGFEFFQEYLDREEPFDPEDYQDRAEEEVKEEHPELDPTSEEFEQLVSEKLNEINSSYYVEQWEEQGRNYDYAREEFDEEQRDNFSESDWLDDQGIRYASDVESNYGHVTWPYYRSSRDDEADIERVALDFMNGIGADSVAYADSYHGRYKKWVGNGWVDIGNNKPDDCFAIEPDGSLHGDDSNDAGLEFVSPPTPLEQVPDLMKRVQNWASEYGVYTGKSNGTSIHTNISVPGYDLDKLDYLKAALLLGDEHVLREFDRIGNTYAAPAIEKVKELVKQKPEKAKELLDKMKSQLNAEASKLIHSGVTNKFTSINTKDNRVEFRSPGGDYLSIIADNPQKMIDTINRMVVTLDAAMDPNKYKEEYQKKLYKVLTGQAGGREAKTGAKQEMKASDKDLLNIFSRYAAGELPKQALKSFVRQAQLERKVARQKDEGVKMWWNVARDGQRMEVVATNELDAKLTAAKEWGIVASDANLSSMTVKPLRPYDDTAGGTQVVAQQPTTPVWGIWDFQRGGFVNSRGGVGDGQGRLIGADTYDAARNAARNNGLLDRLEGGEFEIRQIPQQQSAIPGSNIYRITDTRGGLIAGDEYESDQAALERAQYWAQRRGVDVVVKNARGEEVGRVSASGEIIPAGQQAPQTGNWGLWAEVPQRFAGMSTAPDAELRRFETEQQGRDWLAGTNLNPERFDIREIPADYQRPAQTPAPQTGNWGIWIGASERFAREPGEYPAGQEVPLRRFPSREAAEQFLAQTRAENPRMRSDVEVREIEPAQALPDIFPELPRPQATQQPESEPPRYEMYRISDGRTVEANGMPIQFVALTPEDAERKLRIYAASHNLGAPELFAVRGVLNVPAQTPDQQQGGIVDVAGEQPATSGSFTGEWKVVDPSGNEIYRFSGVGNSQSDANRVAIAWLQRNPRHMVGGVEVLPVMG